MTCHHFLFPSLARVPVQLRSCATACPHAGIGRRQAIVKRLSWPRGGVRASSALDVGRRATNADAGRPPIVNQCSRDGAPSLPVAPITLLARTRPREHSGLRPKTERAR
jgi:hypothetical protein